MLHPLHGRMALLNEYLVPWGGCQWNIMIVTQGFLSTVESDSWPTYSTNWYCRAMCLGKDQINFSEKKIGWAKTFKGI